MKLIFCIDKDNGMMFFGKRQSQDSKLREWIINKVGINKLWMSEYSAKQFTEYSEMIVDDNYISKAETDDYCFVENMSYSTENANEIIICNWNRRYPGDVYLDIDLKAEGFKKVETVEIVGSSHDKITIETYRR